MVPLIIALPWIWDLVTGFPAARAALEATSSPTSDPLSWLINLGVAGIVIVLLVTGQLRTKSEVEHLLAEIEAKNKVIDAVQVQLLSSTLPALANSTRVIEAVPAQEQVLIDQLRRTQADASELIARMERMEKRQ